MNMPIAKGILEDLAWEYGVCLKPVVLRRVDQTTGECDIVEVPCGARLASKCAPCAERNRKLRMQQIRQGWHLAEEPTPAPRPASDEETGLVLLRATLEFERATCERTGQWDQLQDLDDGIAEVDELLRETGVRGKTGPVDESERKPKRRQKRSTRRREDAPELPSMPVDKGRTVGRVIVGSDGTLHRDSMFITLTLDSYGPVHAPWRPGRPTCECGDSHRKDDPSVGTPVDPTSYDYRRAALDAIHGAKVVDRFWQNMRRATGVNIQYAGSVELQKRLAPHWHFAIRGTCPRALVKAVAAATYHQVWWPKHDAPVYTPDRAPVWDDQEQAYVDPDTGAPLPSWDEALAELDALGEDAEPAHVVWLGKVDARGVKAGTKDAEKTVRYVTKYIAKDLTDSVKPAGDAARAHFDRLHHELRHLPCAPTCPNWLLFGSQPKNADAETRRPGQCRGKVHRRETLGFTGRRVLISRQWSNKTLADIREDNRAWVRALLAIGSDESGEHSGQSIQDTLIDKRRYTFELARNGDPDVPPPRVRIMRAIAARNRWRNELDAARRRQDQLSATAGQAA